MRYLIARAVALAVIAAGAATLFTTGAPAGVLVQYQAPADPMTEGFTTVGCCGHGNLSNGSTPDQTAGPIANDLGLPAWSIGGGSPGSQLGYESGTLTPLQQAQISTNGFVLTEVARVIQGPIPVFYSNGSAILGGALYDNGTVRWHIDLSLDSNGDTVVVLPNSVNNAGPAGVVQAPGLSHTLTGLGNGYETYQLVEAPGATTASLFVNGVEVLSGYTGDTTFVSAEPNSLVFSGLSGGTANFDLVSLAVPVSSTPEPASLALLCTGLIGASLIRRRRARPDRDVQ
jgi:PEP-CTERM motif-containing protein